MSNGGNGGNSLVANNFAFDEASSWRRFLGDRVEHMGGFQGNIERAADLMASFGKGRECIRKFFAGKVEVECPDIWLLSQNTDDHTFGIFNYTSPDHTQRALVIRKKFLEHTSAIDLAELKNDDNKVIPRDSILDYYFLSGVEETHHSVYQQINPQMQNTGAKEAAVLTAGEYHAQEHEWQALAFRIKYAREMKLAHQTIDDLVNIQGQAAEVRQAQDLPTDEIPFLR